MTIESYSLVEHFDYMKNCVPQPFYIPSDTVKDIVKCDDEYIIHSTKGAYSITKHSMKKMVDALGIKIKLLSSVCDETDVVDLAMPIINKLFKCFANCFVFYHENDDLLTIIDLNVNTEKGDEGTKYENGPSPWKFDIVKFPAAFTCFADFMNKYYIDSTNTEILVKADDLMQSNNVNMTLFKNVNNSVIQPMLVFNSKFSNMDGFSKINPALYHEETGITISFPMNYAKDDSEPFDDIWKRVMHIYEHTDLNDYIFREVNELAVSNDTPNSVREFISSLLCGEDTLNLNQPIKDILAESVNLVANMKPSKKRKFNKNLGSLIAWALVAKHQCCESCGHIEVH